jgi:hypothetical protein
MTKNSNIRDQNIVNLIMDLKPKKATHRVAN